MELENKEMINRILKHIQKTGYKGDIKKEIEYHNSMISKHTDILQSLKEQEEMVDFLESVIQKLEDNQPKRKQIVIRKNKHINKYWIPEYSLVLESLDKDNRTVIGSFKNGELYPLTQEDIHICENIGLKYTRDS